MRQGGVAALKAALQSVDRKSVKALSISGQQHGFVPVDQQGQVIALRSDIREGCNLCSMTGQGQLAVDTNSLSSHLSKHRHGNQATSPDNAGSLIDFQSDMHAASCAWAACAPSAPLLIAQMPTGTQPCRSSAMPSFGVMLSQLRKQSICPRSGTGLLFLASQPQRSSGSRTMSLRILPSSPKCCYLMTTSITT